MGPYSSRWARPDWGPRLVGRPAWWTRARAVAMACICRRWAEISSSIALIAVVSPPG